MVVIIELMRRCSTMRVFIFVMLLAGLVAQTGYAQYTPADARILPDADDGYNILDFSEQPFLTKGHAVATSPFCYQITEDKHYKAGQIWWPDQLSLAQNLRMDFVIFAGDNNGGADGFAFVFHRDPDGVSATGTSGGGLGLLGIENSLAVEIDTWQNPVRHGNGSCLNVPGNPPFYSGDPEGDHLALVGYGGRTGCPLKVTGLDDEGNISSEEVDHVELENLESSTKCSRFSIVWDYVSATQQRIRVFLADNSEAIPVFKLVFMREDNFFTSQFNLADGEEPLVTWGYTGATGGAKNEQTVCILSGLDPPQGLPDNLNVEAGVTSSLSVLKNDLEASQQNALWVTAIKVPPSHGTAILDIGQKTVGYRPTDGFIGTDNFSYQVCDNPDGTRCYAACAVTNVVVEVGCAGNRTVKLRKVSDDTSCSGTPAGSIEADVLGEPLSSFIYNEDFSIYDEEDVSGTRVHSTTLETSWKVEQYGLRGVVNSEQGPACIRNHLNSGGKYVDIPAKGQYQVDFTIDMPVDVTKAEVFFKIGGSGRPNLQVDLVTQIYVIRIDKNGVERIISKTGGEYIGLWSPNYNNVVSLQFQMNGADEIGATTGPEDYIIRVQVDNNRDPDSSTKPTRLDDFIFYVEPYDVSSDYSSEYSFRWYRGSTVNPENRILNANSRRVSNLPAGQYTVEARLTATDDCPQTPLTPITLVEEGDPPLIFISNDSPVTNCTTSNGQLSATVSVHGSRVTDGHTFTWYETAESLNPISVGAVASNLGAISYTVRVVNKDNGCTGSKAETVESSLVSPLITLEEEQDALSCTPGTAVGSARVSVSGESNTDYTFQWFNGRFVPPSTLPLTPDFTGALQDALDPGFYTVRALKKDNQCASPPTEVHIEDAAIGVLINVVENLGSASCIAPHGGKLSVNASYNNSPNGTADYTFAWFNGANTLLANAITSTSGVGNIDPFLSPASTLNQLPAAQYTVLVTHISSQCSASATLTVATVTPTLPIIEPSNIVAANNTVCSSSGFTGSLDASNAVTTAGIKSVAGYTYRLTSSTFGTPDFRENDTGIFTDLSHGNYALRVTDLANHCASESHSARLLRVNSLVDITELSKKANTACVASAINGEVTYRVNPAPDITTTTFRHQIYRGYNTDPSNLVEEVSNSNFEHTFTGLGLGRDPGAEYRILVTELSSECVVNHDVFIVQSTFFPTYALIESTIHSQSSCVSPNGSITVHLVNEDGNAIADPVAEGYAFDWRNAAPLLPLPPLLISRAVATATLADLTAQQYRVHITGPNGCSSATGRVWSVSANIPTVGVRILESAALTACRAADANGTLQAVATGFLSRELSFEWFTQPLGSLPPLQAGPSGTGFSSLQEVQNRWEGEYAVRITHVNSGCVGQNTIRLESTNEAPVLSHVSSTANTACAIPFNGETTVQLSYGGAVISNFTDFSFTLNGATRPAGNTFTQLGESLSPGHDLQVNYLGCRGSLSVPIQNNLLPPILGNATVNPSRSCDENQGGTGSIVVRPDGVAGGAGYTFRWFNESFSLTAVEIGGETSFDRDELISGNYAVHVTNDATKCESTRNFTLTLIPNIAPGASLTVSPVTNCNPFNGSLQGTLSSSDDPRDYEWFWFDGLDETTPLTASNGVTINNERVAGLPPGNYSVRYTERATHCPSPQLYTTSVVFSSGIQPQFTPSNPLPAGDCKGANGTARVAVTGPVGKQFTIHIYEDAHLTFPPSLVPVFTNANVGVSDYNAQLRSGLYTARVIETTTRCESVQSLIVSYVNAPTVVTITNVQPANCAPYTNAAGTGGQGGATGSVTIQLQVRDNTAGINHDNYQIFLYASNNLNDRAALSPTPNLQSGSREWRQRDGRPALVQRIAGAQTGTATGSVAVPGNPPIPAVTGSLDRGVATIVVLGETFDIRDYIFAGLSGNTDAQIDNYLVVAAEEGEANCLSTPQYFNVPRENDELSVTAQNIVSNVSCGPRNTATGTIEIAAITRGIDPVHNTSAALQNNYRFEWFEGGTVNSARLGTNVGIANEERASGLPSGNYAVRITKTTIADGDDFQCNATFAFSVNNEPATYTFVTNSLIATDQQSCTSPNGTITVNNIEIGGSSVTFASLSTDFEVLLHDANNILHTPNIFPGSPTATGLDAGTYRLVFRNISTQCTSLGQLQAVADDRQIPGIDKSNSTLTPNTSCVAPFNGGVNLAYTPNSPPASTLGYTWYLGEVPPSVGTRLDGSLLANGSTPVGHSTGNLSALIADTYSVLVLHGTSGCRAVETFGIPDGRVTPTVSFGLSAVAHSTTCEVVGGTPIGNGTVTINATEVLPAGANYNVSLYSNDVPPLSLVGASQPFDLTLIPPPTSVVHRDLLPNPSTTPYYLRLEDQNTGCVSSFVRFVIVDRPHIPKIANVVITPDVGCNAGSLGLGAVEITLDFSDPVYASYSYNVTIDGNLQSGITTADVLPIRGLAEGNVDIEIQNVDNACTYTTPVEIVKDTPVFLIERLSRTEQTHCNPENGFVQVLGLSFNGASVIQTPGQTSVYTDYDFAWTNENGNTLAITSHEYEQVNLASADYSVSITHTLSACEIQAVYTVNEALVFPLLSLLQAQHDQSCEPAAADGILVGTADGQDETYDGNLDGNPDYNFTWFEGAVGGLNQGNTARVTGLAGGLLYTLQVHNQLTGCRAEQNITLQQQTVNPIVDVNSQIDYTDVTQCIAPFTGAVQLRGVTPGALADYRILFYDADPTGTATALQTVTNGAATFSSLAAQVYYIQLTHQVFGCASEIYEVAPLQTLQNPTLTIENFTLQTHCNPLDPNGIVEVSANGTQDVNLFRFEWSIGGTAVVSVNQSRVEKLAAGDYTIKVTENSTGCFSERVFTLRDLIINPLTVTFQQRPNDKCLPPYSGILIADVETKLPGKQLADYGFFWKEGTVAPTIVNADHTNVAWESLNEGTYTVVAYDIDDPACTSDPTSVAVENGRQFPDPYIRQVGYLTNCDPLKANAVLEAIIPGKPGYDANHKFIWFEGATLPVADTLSISAVSSGLTEKLYSTEVENTRTNCKQIVSFTVKTAHQIPEAPTLILERSRTSCLNPNGSAFLLLKDDPLLYTFEWYIEEDLNNILFTTQRVDSLDIATYHTYITHTETGCRSLRPQTVTIFDITQEKRFAVDVEASLCTEPTGTAIILPIDPFVLEKVSWTRVSDNQIFEYQSLVEAQAGAYEVTIVDDTGCTSTNTFTITDKVLPYNAVSANGDGINDVFVIDCIERYASNVVHIFDRDGNLVFEKEGYNNLGNVFTGEGNAGFYVGGKKLPDGTYYYVIDLGDSSLPETGFMELIH